MILIQSVQKGTVRGFKVILHFSTAGQMIDHQNITSREEEEIFTDYLEP